MKALEKLGEWLGLDNYKSTTSAQRVLAFAGAGASACGAADPDKKETPASACGAADPDKKEDKPSACGSACGAADPDKKESPASACGAADPDKK